jgi:hypothetical protein
MMNWQHKIFTIAFLGLSVIAQAQDSTIVPLVQEQTSAVVGIRDQIYASPALKVYQRQFNYSLLNASFRHVSQDQYVQQEGSGQQSFTVSSETYLKNTKTLTLWGNAYYNNQQLYKVNFNETADYHLVYPYVMADSIGGDLKAETYAFSGGLAKAVGLYQLGFNVGYRGLQSYRDRDPRPKNISSEINIDLAISRKIRTKYAIALDVSGTKYNQKNKLNFVSELGKPMVYHDAGLGVYNKLLSGSLLSAWYTGTGYGASLKISPLTYQGAFIGANYHRTDLKKRTSKSEGIDIFEAGKIQESTFGGNAGYLYEKDRHHFIVQGTATMVKRKGIEAIFDIRDAEVSIKKISEAPRYLHQYDTYNFKSVYGVTGGYIDWYLGVEATYQDHLQRYAEPDREMSYQTLVAGGNITLRKQLGKQLLTLTGKLLRQENLNNSYYWNDVSHETAIYSMLNSNFAYLTASSLNYGGSARIDFPINKKLSCFIKAEYNGRTTIGRQDFNIMTAFQF